MEETTAHFQLILGSMEKGSVDDTLQSRQKWNLPKCNCKVGDIELLKEEAEINRWPMAKIIATNKGNDGFVRSVM